MELDAVREQADIVTVRLRLSEQSRGLVERSTRTRFNIAGDVDGTFTWSPE